MKGPNWLSKPEMWPALLQTKPSKETEAEAKPVKKVFHGATETEDTPHQVLVKHGLWQTIRTTPWVARFLQTCKKGKKYQLSGSLNKFETDKQVEFWVGRAQNSRFNADTFQEDQHKLNLQKNEEGLYECRGRHMEATLSTYHQIPC